MVSYGFPMVFPFISPQQNTSFNRCELSTSSAPFNSEGLKSVRAWSANVQRKTSSGTIFLWPKVVKNMQNTAYMFLLKKHRNLNLFDFFGISKMASLMCWDLNWTNRRALRPLAPGRYDVGGGTCNLPIHHLVSPSCVSWNSKGCKVWGQIPSHWPCHWHTMDACLAPTRQPRGFS